VKIQRTRDKVLLAIAVAFIPATVILFGNQYLRPAPLWLKVVIVPVGVSLIASLAVYSRRRRVRSSA
jgi:hypothetical protein